MEVILTKDVERLGQKDAVINVSTGYARNYLIPKKLAVPADKNSLKAVEGRKNKAAAKLEKEKEGYRQVAEKLDNLGVEIKADVGEEGKLFGSVTSQDIAAAVKDLVGVDLDKKQIMLDDPIKIAGKKDVKVKFASDIKATLSILVLPNK